VLTPCHPCSLPSMSVLSIVCAPCHGPCSLWSMLPAVHAPCCLCFLLFVVCASLPSIICAFCLLCLCSQLSVLSAIICALGSPCSLPWLVLFVVGALCHSLFMLLCHLLFMVSTMCHCCSLPALPPAPPGCCVGPPSLMLTLAHPCLGFAMGMGKPMVPDKWVLQVRVRYPICHTQAIPCTCGAVSWVPVGIFTSISFCPEHP